MLQQQQQLIHSDIINKVFHTTTFHKKRSKFSTVTATLIA